jgi:hypothetical protein
MIFIKDEMVILLAIICIISNSSNTPRDFYDRN